ncbi:nitroreductase family protein, partial [Desulfomarina sp.]
MFLELLKKRRSIRRFQEKPVEKEKIDMLMEAALRSPSSRSLNPWEFVVVTDRSLLEELATSKPHGGSFIKNAPLAIVVCGDPGKSDVWV